MFSFSESIGDAGSEMLHFFFSQGKNVCTKGSKGGHGTSKTTSSPMTSTDKATSSVNNFISKNWHLLLLYVVSWVSVVVGYGVTYGFKATAWPLSVGMGAGLAFGTVIGVLTVLVFDPKNAYKDKNTVWGFINTQGNLLDFGTKQIVVSVAVTVYLAWGMYFPASTGFASGALIGNHLAAKIGYEQNLGSEKKVYHLTQEELNALIRQVKKGRL